MWLKNAQHSNAMTALVWDGIKDADGVELVQPVESNALFIRVPRNLIQQLQDRFCIQVWRSTDQVLGIMTSFDATETDINTLVSAINGAAH